MALCTLAHTVLTHDTQMGPHLQSEKQCPQALKGHTAEFSNQGKTLSSLSLQSSNVFLNYFYSS